jgi:glyoxylase-like metal-dependent hydrolase (beta-lactamase superfamily II)
MPRLPLEDNYTDVIGKAQRGLQIGDPELAALAGVSAADLAAVKAGSPIDAVIRRVARHLKLSPDALEDLAHGRWYPEQARFRRGFAMFATAYGDMMVNSYLIWDMRERTAAVFDTGADCGELLDVVRAEKLQVHHVFLTHTHEDHVADLARLVAATRAQVWASEREPADFPGARTFAENAHFHVGELAIKALSTWGHSPGQTTYYVTGLGRPLAVVGDSLFAGSMGGSATHYLDQYRNDRQKIFSLPRDTVLACGHGPLSSVAQELIHNPFFAP